MTEDDGKIEEWMQEFAWRGRDEVQQGINIIDNKAMSIINFSSILIPIITGILFYIKDKQIDINMSFKYFNISIYILLIGSVIFLIITIFIAFMVTWPRDHGIIPVHAHFKACGSDDIHDILFDTSKEIADWQEKLLDIADNKIKYFKKSSYSFVIALFLVFLSAISIFLF